MNFSKTVPFIFLLTLLSTTPAFALGRPQTNPGQGIKQEIKTTQTAIKPTIVADKLALRRQNVERIGQKIIDQLNNRLAYLNKIRDLLQSKITSLTSTKDMTAAKGKLSQYNSAQYTVDLQKLTTDIGNISTSDKPNSLMPTLRADAKLVLTDLKNLHQTLIDTLRSIVQAKNL